MNSFYYINPQQESNLISRISELKQIVNLDSEEVKGTRYRDNSYIIFKIKQKWVMDNNKTAQDFLDSLSSNQIDEYIMWGIKDAAATDYWYNEKSRHDALEIESNFKNKFILANREIDIFLEEANKLVNEMLKELNKPNASSVLSKVMYTMESLTASIRQLQSRREFRHIIPNELEEKMESVNRIITEKSLGNDLNSWYDLLREGINEFISDFDVDIIKQELEEDNTDKMELRRHVIRYSRAIQKTIDDYEKKFGSSFDPSLQKSFKDKKYELAKTFSLYLDEPQIVSNVPLDIQTLDSDKLLDLYEQIKQMPDGDEKLEKIREFEKMNNILKSSLKISKRD